ncbi:MAG: beta-glucuronidase [Acidimicrobiales bacterium]
MLRPQENARREAKRLDGLWDFSVDTNGVGREERWWQGPLVNAIPMPVPCSYNDVLVDPAVHEHVGDVWYQRTVFVPRGWQGGRVVLRFDAATHRADVWVGDEQVVSHEGGYTPFEADLTDVIIDPGSEVRITVAVNNELTWESIPPGVVEEMPDGQRRQRQYHDFFNYAGLHRGVWLYSTAASHIADVTVTTDREPEVGFIRYSTVIDAPGEPTVRVELYDAEGTPVAATTGGGGELLVPAPHLWQPGNAYLYELRVDLLDGDELIDRYMLPVGIRTVRIDGSRFLINDEPFYFRGFGMHEDLNVHGRGHDDASTVHDFALLGWLGANSFRTSHYPYAEEVLDLADRLGLVIIDETAAVGLNLGVGGGLFLGAPKTTFTEETIGSDTQATHRRAIEELIARDKNHPCVVLWSLANEPESHTDEARTYFEPLFDLARDCDPTRPVGFVNMMFAQPDACKVSELADVIMINRYYGWYVEPGDLAAAERGLERELLGWVERYGKPIIVTEYGADAMPGLHAIDAVVWTEEYQVALLDTYHRVFDRIDAVVGEQVWNFADFATPPSFMRVDGNKKGVFTRDRRPKAAARHLRQRWLASS